MIWVVISENEGEIEMIGYFEKQQSKGLMGVMERFVDESKSGSFTLPVGNEHLSRGDAKIVQLLNIIGPFLLF